MTFPHTGAGRHQAPASPLRRWTRITLIVGSVLAVLSLLGPVWVVRAGVVVALGSALLGCLLAWQEIQVERRAHAAAMLAASRAHGRQLHEQWRHNAAVVDTLTERMRGLASIAETRLRTIGDLTVEISSLRGANSLLRADVAQRESSIVSLRRAVRVREAELVALREGDAVADIHVMPRRTLVETDDTMVQDDCLAAVEERVVEFLTDAVALPNYEGERRFA